MLKPSRGLLAFTLLVCALPAVAGMGLGNNAPVVDAVSVAPASPNANTSATLSCSAHDTDGSVVRIRFTVTGGTLPGGGTAADAAITAGASVSATMAWSTPAPGSYSASCAAADNGGLFGGAATSTKTLSITVLQPSAPPPVIDSLVASTATVLVGGSVVLTAAAHDPAGGALSYSWTAASGSLAPSGASATWTAPSAGGSYAVSLAATSSAGQTASASITVQVALGFPQGELRAMFAAPRRVTALATGDLLVVDAGARQLWLVTRNGYPKASSQLPDAPVAVTSCAGQPVVVTAHGRLFELDPADGHVIAERPVLGAPLTTPSGISCDAGSGRLYVAEAEANRVRALLPDGSAAFFITAAATAALTRPVDVAVDPGAPVVWVLLDSNETGDLLHSFTLDGAYLGSTAAYGSGVGKLSRGGGVAVMPDGRVVASDGFQGVLETFTRGGAPLGELGTYGADPGQLRQPAGLTPLSNGDVLVANLDLGRLERFGTGAPLPSCAGDSDCDGLPDAWELAHHLNPYDARDALADNDGDGLNNRQEYAGGTDPCNADSDGDGYPDGDEVANGFDPLDPNDHRPVLAAGPRVVSDPGLVRLLATLSGARQSCTLSWSQLAGPPVALRDAGTVQPSFVGRVAGVYQFRGVATCGSAASAPAVVEAQVREVSPRPSPGLLRVVHAGKSLLLDGSSSSDANGGALSLQWDQTLGPPVLATSLEPVVEVRADQLSLYSFLLTATDEAGNAASAEVPVLAVSSGRQAPTAIAATPVFASAGAAVALDASGSAGAANARLRFDWSQTAGPAVTLSDAHAAKPTFVPASPGRYELEVSVSDPVLRSPPAKVTVYVSGAAGLPVASAPSLLSAAAGEPVTLDGSASVPAVPGEPLAYRWTQVSGPAAGLTDADRPAATAVPFDAGTYVFQLSVSEGGAESAPAFVRVDASSPGHLLPVAVARGPSVAEVEREVSLDGTRSSDGDGHELRYRWRQVDGPWVALEGDDEAQPHFKPQLPGLYVFELMVDDGSIQSGPARLGVMVFARSGGDR